MLPLIFYFLPGWRKILQSKSDFIADTIETNYEILLFVYVNYVQYCDLFLALVFVILC